MQKIVIKRVFGRAKEKEKVEKFQEWFSKNLFKLEETFNDNNPLNGQMTIDYQYASESYIIEIKTADENFADEIKNKYTELEFSDSAIIGNIIEISDEEMEDAKQRWAQTFLCFNCGSIKYENIKESNGIFIDDRCGSELSRIEEAK